MADKDKLPHPLSAKDPSNFAYPTMKDRIPVILSKIVDHLSRNMNKLSEKYGGKDASEEVKSVIGALSQLRYEVMTNKPATMLRDSRSDVEAWNRELLKQDLEEASVTWFDSAWLWMECYLYRRVQEATAMCKLLKDLDVFENQKQDAFVNSYKPMITLTTYLLEVLDKVEKGISEKQLAFYFTEFVQISLWGNKHDMSISAGSDNYQVNDPLEQLHKLKSKILVDETDAVYQALRVHSKDGGKGGRIDIVMDNTGFEFITDLCLAEFLMVSGLATTIYFHVKAMPWFVSDTTVQDFHWTLKKMSAMNHMAMSQLSQKWKTHLSNSSWILTVNDFWTMPNDFSQMQELCPSLYSELAKSDLIIFKGDLNYRKLEGDLTWNFTTDFFTSLRGFCPAPLCTLRTLKSDSVVGLKPGQAKTVADMDKKWMLEGNWAVISFTAGGSS